MTISESTIKEMRKSVSVIENEVKDREGSLEGCLLTKDSSNDIYLISDDHVEYACMSADSLGIRRECVVFVPTSQPLRSQVIIRYRKIQSDHLIGFFTDKEIEYLTT
jgi:hypothetical protein